MTVIRFEAYKSKGTRDIKEKYFSLNKRGNTLSEGRTPLQKVKKKKKSYERKPYNWDSRPGLGKGLS